MTDRAILESLGYSIRASGETDGLWLYDKDGEFCGSGEESFISQILNNEYAWLELDDALAERGFESILTKEWDASGKMAFRYEAPHHAFDMVESDWHPTRLAAVREVYERILEMEGATK